MDKMARFIVKNRKWICIAFAIVIVVSAIAIPFTGVNYDLTKYLPEDMATTEALVIMQEDFGYNGTMNLMIKEVSPGVSLDYKRKIENVEGVLEVVWLDNMVVGMMGSMSDFMLKTALNAIVDGGAGLSPEYQEMIQQNQGQIDKFYKNKSVNYQIIMTNGDYDKVTAKAIREIEKIIDKPIYLTGQSATAFNSVATTNRETIKAAAFIVPIMLIILVLATTAWFEPIIFILSIGIAVLINIGTNIFVGDISFLTHSSGMILQMALAMDYSIFLLNRYKQERTPFVSAEDAMARALKHSFSPISASSLTTIAGFVALMFMRYTIGFDMGLVLAKGILISLITVFLLMPGVIVYSDKLIQKTAHKKLFFRTKAISKGIKKSRYILPVLIIALIIPAIVAQSNNAFTYGESATMGGKGSRLDNDKIATQEVFGINNPLVIILKQGDWATQVKLANQLSEVDAVETGAVQSYALIRKQAIDVGIKTFQKEYLANNPNATAEEIAQALQAQMLDIEQSAEESIAVVAAPLNGKNYTRIVVNLLTSEEGEDATKAVITIQGICREVLGDNEYYMTGPAVAALDIKAVVEKDYALVSILSMVLVGFILLLTFKSIFLPVLLLAVIQGSIWINMAIPYLLGNPLIFIGYMIISAVQLGATIDYGILFTSRYIENRSMHDRYTSMYMAYEQSAHSIVTSGGILCAAGFVLAAASSMEGMVSLGLLLGQGALLSMLLVLTLLPQMLILCDGLIRRTTIGGRRKMIDDKYRKAKEPPEYVELVADSSGDGTLLLIDDGVASMSNEMDRGEANSPIALDGGEDMEQNTKVLKSKYIRKKKTKL